MIIEPTVGRVVWYRPTESEGLSHKEDQPCIAHVVAVHSPFLINVIGFDANGVFFFRSSIFLKQDDPSVSPIAEGEPYCEWMPYQIGQAKKHAEESA